MNAVQSVSLATVMIPYADPPPEEVGGACHRSGALLIGIAASTAMVAALDFWTGATLIGSIVFIVPLALCALQRSKTVLWATAVTAGIVTLAAGFWGVSRADAAASQDMIIDRGLLVASLLTLTVFIHLWLRKARTSAIDASEIKRQSNALSAQNEQLEVLVAAATRDIDVRRDAEKHLAQMEARYRGLLEAAPDAMVVINERGEIVLLNLQAEKQFGYRRDELLGQPVTNLIPEGFAERLIADGARTAAEALAQQIGTGIELVARRKDGSEFPIELMLSPLESPEGILVTAAIRDIGVRRDAERHLARMEARYRGLLEAAPDAMVVVNAGGEIVLLNLQAEKQFGYRRDELLGQPVTNIIPEGFAERLITDGARSAAEALAQQIGAGIELVGRRQNGSEFPIELMLSPLDSAEGILVTAAIRDVTARHADHEALRASEEWHRMAVEVTEMGTWIWDIEKSEFSWSDQFRKMFGLTADSTFDSQTVLQIIHPDDRAGVEQSTKNAIEWGSPYEFEHRVIWPDSSVHWIASRGGVRRNPEGVVVSLQGATFDITERKAAQNAIGQREAMQSRAAELTRSNDDLQQFAYVAAHDLQEPLRMVSSYTQLLAERYKGRLDADADQYIAFAVNGAQRMQMLIEDLLAYCQVGTAAKDLRETSTSDALNEALLNLKGGIDESGAEVTYAPLPTLIADRAQLVQLFQNVVGNAIKYRGAEPPRVHVSAKKNQAGEWIFSLRDNGLGIDPKHFDKIFVMFKRLHSRGTFSGTGIGLTLCKKIAERHGGRMWVESMPGKGSTFYLMLPGGGVH